MKIYPNTFLNDSYLKYIGWMLYDKVRVFLGFLLTVDEKVLKYRVSTSYNKGIFNLCIVMEIFCLCLKTIILKNNLPTTIVFYVKSGVLNARVMWDEA